MLPAPVIVSGELLGVLVRDRGVGELPVVLAGQARWYPSFARPELTRAVHDECARLGWVDRHGDLEPDVVAALEVLCRPAVAFFGWITTGDTTVGVLSAAIGKQSVLAGRHGDHVSLACGRWSRLAETLVDQTPAVPKGAGTPVRVRRTDVATVDDRGRTLSETGVGHHRVGAAVLAVKRLTELPELGTGELHVAVRDKVGRVRTSSQPLRYTDTSAGRYLVLLDPDEDDDPHALVAPADRAALADRLNHMHQSLL